MDILAGLNPHQREACEVLKGPLLVLAGAGSGKTKVLTCRIANLIAHGIDARNILAVTFTNKAAKEMQARIEKLLGGRNAPHVGTFHSICVRILREDIEHLGNGLSKNFVIFDTADTQSLMKVIMKEQQIDPKEFKIKPIMSHISGIKNSLGSPDAHFESRGMMHNQFAEVVCRVYPIYQRRLIEHNALDFDDLIQRVVNLWEECPEILEKYRNRWQHVLVDEYQDTNFAQYRFIRLLTDVHQNLCVVGDDHQSIYSFRGADYRNILDFETDFPTAKTVKLEQNYRSSANILNNANALIGYNESGREKNLWTESEAGSPVKITEVSDEKDEGRHITEKIKTYQDDFPLKDMAILYRMNAQSRALEESLMRNQIPYQIIGGTRFFDRAEIKDVLSYLRLIFNPRDDVAFLRVINTPARKIGPATLQILKDYASNYNLSMLDILEEAEQIAEIPATKRVILKNFYQIITDLKEQYQDKPISILLEQLIDKIEYFKWLDDGSAEGQSRIENVRELFSVAGRYDSADHSLAAFLEGVALVADIDRHDENSDKITLMTVHASKGLEFPIVFLPGWEEGLFPGSASQFSPDSLEEERRLGYVAITRAEQECEISYARSRMMFGKTDFSTPSKFLTELDETCVQRNASIAPPTRNIYRQRSETTPNFEHTLLTSQPKTKQEAIFGVAQNETEYKSGDTIRHADFGDGTLITIAGDVMSIAFKGLGIKKIVASVAPIEKVEEGGTVQ